MLGTKTVDALHMPKIPRKSAQFCAVLLASANTLQIPAAGFDSTECTVMLNSVQKFYYCIGYRTIRRQ